MIRRLVDGRPTYGYRRVTALANRALAAEGKPGANPKRAFRIMKRQGLLLQRHTGRHQGRLHDTTVLRQIAGRFDDYNESHPHSGLGLISPGEFIRAQAR
jgi:transposase InsO family protein